MKKLEVGRLEMEVKGVRLRSKSGGAAAQLKQQSDCTASQMLPYHALRAWEQARPKEGIFQERSHFGFGGRDVNSMSYEKWL